MNSKFLKGGLVLLSASVASEVLWQLYLCLKKKLWSNQNDHEVTIAETSITSRNSNKKTSDLWNTVLFFPDKANTAQNSAPFQLYAYLESATRSLRICVFLAALPAFEHIIFQKWKDGVTIQVFTDHDTMTAHSNINCRAFQEAGELDA